MTKSLAEQKAISKYPEDVDNYDALRAAFMHGANYQGTLMLVELKKFNGTVNDIFSSEIKQQMSDVIVNKLSTLDALDRDFIINKLKKVNIL